jgi:hypothetical protein
MTEQETAAPTEGSSEDISLSEAISQIQEEPEATETVEAAPAEGSEPANQKAADTKEDENLDAAEEEKSPYSKAFTVLKKREKALTAKEKQIEEMEKRFTPLMHAEKLLRDDPAEFFTKALEAIAPENHGELLEEAFTKLSMKVLGVDAPKDMQEQSQFKKLQRELESYKAEQARKEQEREDAIQMAQYEAKLATAHAQIKTSLDREKFPYLVSQEESAPEEVVWQLISQDYEANLAAGKEEYQPMSIEEAASLADEHFKNVAQKWAKLVPPPPTPPQVTNGNKTKPPATLTQAQTSKAPVRARSEDTEAERLKRALELIKEQP